MVSRGTLAKYIRRGFPFIETGTREGNTLAWASDLGAHPALSTEIVPDLAKKAQKRFEGSEFVQVLNTDSPLFLRAILTKVGVSSVFWLDAHTKIHSPILEELHEISLHHIKTHTIMIDDVRLLVSRRWKISLAQVIDAVFKVNPNYCLSMEDGYQPGDILVAKIYGE